MGNVRVDSGEGFGWTGGVEVMDFPIFDARVVIGKTGADNGPVLGFLERDDVRGRHQVGEGEVAAGRPGLRKRDAAAQQRAAGVDGQITADEMGGQAAGKGPPGPASSARLMIKKRLGIAAAVKITGAEK